MKKIYHFLVKIGINPLVFFNFIIHFPSVISDLIKFKKLLGKNSEFKFGSFYPITIDKRNQSGKISGAYFHHDLLVAKRIYNEKPQKHIDIGSRIDGFVAHVAVFREIEIFDIRPIESKIQNIIFRQADFITLPEDLHNYCDSVSSLNAIEHFGLGRYGDPIDPLGHVKAIRNIHQVLKPNGRFYFSVPIGRQRIEFNAHRVFDISYLLILLQDMFDLVSFSYVDDNGDLYENVELENEKIKANYGCYFGFGIFELIKK